MSSCGASRVGETRAPPAQQACAAAGVASAIVASTRTIAIASNEGRGGFRRKFGLEIRCELGWNVLREFERDVRGILEQGQTDPTATGRNLNESAVIRYAKYLRSGRLW